MRKNPFSVRKLGVMMAFSRLDFQVSVELSFGTDLPRALKINFLRVLNTNQRFSNPSQHSLRTYRARNIFHIKNATSRGAVPLIIVFENEQS